MCYSITFGSKELTTYKQFINSAFINGVKIEAELDDVITNDSGPDYFAEGFSHPDIPVLTQNDALEISLFNWGLIPFWVKDDKTAAKIRNQTLNARSETMFEKPAFRDAAKKRRCLILIDGFFEYHHFKSKAYPYHIKLKNDKPMLLGGLWDKWVDPEFNNVHYTVSIITTKANELMTTIHNNPKLKEPRMPFIVPSGLESTWLNTLRDKQDIDELMTIVKPYNNNELEAYTVHQLKGKNGVGNSPEAIKPYNYENLL